MKKPELLAPAGNMECLKAAVNAGCDAVYLGGYTFGARNYAGNFSNDEIVEAINYCHIYGVKVYITVNTLVYEDEVDMFMDYVDFLYKSNVDALIIQDLGMLDLIRKTYPNLELHASTQMHIHSLEGVLFAQKMGLKRVVLARELSINEIKKIKENSNIDIEIFVHGALCISYSGQCLMSSLIGGRSGNRGTCTQCCRMKYDIYTENKRINENKYLLSTKDLNTIKNIGKLIDLGITSFKIEGRMKRPEYVYLIISLYRKAIDEYIKTGKINISNNDEIEMKKIFNRNFTKGFLFNEENKDIVNTYRPNHIGIEIGNVIDINKNKIKIKLNEILRKNDGIRIIGDNDMGFNVTKMYLKNKPVEIAYKGDIIEIYLKEKIKMNSKVLKTTDILQLNQINEKIINNKKIPIYGKIKCFKDKNIELMLTDLQNEIVVMSEYKIEQSNNSVTTKEQIKTQIFKMGGTVYELKNLEIEMDNDVFIRLSMLNLIRRQALDLLTEKRLYNIPYVKESYNIDLPDFKKEKNTNILVSKKEEYLQIKNKFNNLYIDDYKEFKKIDYSKKIFKLPRVMKEYKEFNDSVLIGEVGSVYKYKNFITDFSLNVTNSYSVALLHSLGAERVTLSYELNDKQIKDIIDSYHKRYNKHPNLELIVSSYPEAMITKFKILDYYNIKSGYLVDQFKNKFKVVQNNDFSIIYHYKKIEINDYQKYFNYGINNIRIHMNNL